MSVAGAVGHYAKTIAPEWDVEDVAARVQTVKEGHFHELTEPGLAAFGGIRALILEARSLGMVVGIGSSGAACTVLSSARRALGLTAGPLQDSHS